MTKTKAERSHFRQRCIERLGMSYDQQQLLNLLHGGKMDFLQKQSNRTTVWKKDNAVFVYDKSRKTFVTALTYDMWKSGKPW